MKRKMTLEMGGSDCNEESTIQFNESDEITTTTATFPRKIINTSQEPNFIYNQNREADFGSYKSEHNP